MILDPGDIEEQGLGTGLGAVATAAPAKRGRLAHGVFESSSQARLTPQMQAAATGRSHTASSQPGVRTAEANLIILIILMAADCRKRLDGAP
jgi:hypothetical protein